MTTNQQEDPDFSVRPKGETQVWLSGAGLALGTLMVVGLLGLVLVQGLTVFWPHKVVEIQLKPNSEFSIRGSTTLAGQVTKRQKRIQDDSSEWQLFIGNKETYGLGFHFVDESDIASTRFPPDIAIAQRTEYGDAIFYPVELTTEDGQSFSAGADEFFPTLKDQLKKNIHRRETIHRIEKTNIGSITREIESLRIKIDQIRNSDSSETHLKKLTERKTQLEDAYQELATKAKTLRSQMDKGHLQYRLPTGELSELPLGNFIRIHRPNAMNWVEKVGFFFSSIGDFLTERPREANTEGGIFPAIFGTFVMTVLMSACVMPFGVIAAIYLREYARQGTLVRAVRISVNNLAGVPSIVFGVFGLGFFVYFLGGSIDHLLFSEKLPTATFGTGGIFWAALTLALMTVPVVIVATEEALAAVPRGLREASLACGASKWQTIQRIVLPVSAPGILTGLILAMARGAGEVAPLMLVGVVKLAPSLPVDGVFPYIHLERKFMHLGFHIYDLGFQSPDSEAARPMVFATTLLLIGLVVFLNMGAIFLRTRLRKKYQSSNF